MCVCVCVCRFITIMCGACVFCVCLCFLYVFICHVCSTKCIPVSGEGVVRAVWFRFRVCDTQTHTQTRVCVCVCVCVCLCVSVCVCVYMYRYIIYILYPHPPTHTHTHTHPTTPLSHTPVSSEIFRIMASTVLPSRQSHSLPSSNAAQHPTSPVYFCLKKIEKFNLPSRQSYLTCVCVSRMCFVVYSMCSVCVCVWMSVCVCVTCVLMCVLCVCVRRLRVCFGR